MQLLCLRCMLLHFICKACRYCVATLVAQHCNTSALAAHTSPFLCAAFAFLLLANQGLGLLLNATLGRMAEARSGAVLLQCWHVVQAMDKAHRIGQTNFGSR